MGDTHIKIPAELFAIAESSHFEGTWDAEILEAGPDDYRFQEPVAWGIDVTNTGEALLVQGRAEANAVTACARCLEDVPCVLEGDIQGYFLLHEEAPAPDDLDDDEFDVLPADHIIDLEPLIAAALLMDVFDVPLCKDDCLGLCPSCGANLNEGPCECGGDETLAEFEEAANPFAVLKNLDLS